MTEIAVAPTTIPATSSMSLSGAQKVAALLITIGTAAAAKIMTKLPPDAVEMVAAQLLKTPAVAAEVRDQVMGDTYSALFSQMGDLQGGSDYALEVFIEAFGESAGMTLLDRVNASVVRPPFDFLARVDPLQVAQQLSSEHPQTIAIVLAHLEPRTAANILKLLDPPSLQVEVAYRIALTEQTTPDAIAMVEEGIRRRMTSVVQSSTQVGGKKPLAQVLNQVDRSTEKAILAELHERDAQTADDVRKFMFVFEDIKLLDDRSMQRLMKDLDNKDLALALRNVPEDLKQQFLRNMSQRAAETLREEMSISGQVKMKNVEEAQGRIVEIIKRLEDNDEVFIDRGGDDGLV
jgi:flagellar motor switch protein FliG